ncbi:uncharacterized protein LOC128216475 [Mya arenaria]|uniref:uncharacterized protein LOC128216475 n=1 Tax=Mya arenaria TaxID=6604 RepID=UPI0022E3A033|nr:uncharacterized protein LOC128216475 [Mya arenaria]
MASRGSPLYKGSDLIHDYSCFTCEENDLDIEAQHFCPQCEHYLCDKCVKMHADYLKKHVVYGRGDIHKWAGFSMDRCAQHGKELEAHCNDHNELCCSICVTLNHRLCRSINPLPDLARDFLKTPEFKQLPAAVEKMMCRLNALKIDRLKDQAFLKDSYKNIIAEIKAVRKEINQILDKLEKKTVEQLDRIMEDLEKTIKDDLETCAHIHDQLSTMITKIKQIAGINKENSSYIGFRKCQSKLSEAECLVQKIQGKEQMMFKSDKDVLSFLRKFNSLGNVDSIHVYKAQSSSRCEVRIKKDKKECDIVGICELSSGEVVVADKTNSRVKLLSSQYVVISNCKMPSPPQNLCHTTGSEVAVAVGDINTTVGIHFLTVTKNKLQAVRKFTTDHNFYSIAHHQGQLYVCSQNALYVYTLDGNIIKKICFDNFPSCVCVSPDGESIYVTIRGKLITLDTSGRVYSTVEDPDLGELSGLCVSPSGHVFVCGRGSHTVVQVDQEGRRKLTTVVRQADGLWLPQSVWFSEQTSTLMVGNDGKDDITVVKLC